MAAAAAAAAAASSRWAACDGRDFDLVPFAYEDGKIHKYFGLF